MNIFHQIYNFNLKERKMKQLIIFDIENIQSDYSCVMECISLLKKNDFDEVGNLIQKNMRNKFHRATLTSKIGAPRYFECPQGHFVPLQESSKMNVLAKENLVCEEYYKITKNSKIDDISFEYLSQLYYLNSENKCYKAELPYTFLPYLPNINKGRTKLQEALNNNEVYYHIRIKINMETLYNLQYLGLLLKKFSTLVDQKRISVLLLSNDLPLKYYPFCNPKDEVEIKNVNDSYKTFSRYLRLLAHGNTGVIFAPFYDAEDGAYVPSVFPMNYKDASIGSKFFPLMDIGEKEYIKLFGNSNPSGEQTEDVLSSEIKRENLYKEDIFVTNKYALFQTGTKRFFNAGDKDPHEAMLAFVAETAWQRLRKSWMDNHCFDENGFAYSRDRIIDIFTKEKNNWITFSLFSFIFSGTSNDKSFEHINEAYQIARDLSNGLQQLIQNAIQHSEKHSCFFTFFLDEESKNLKLFVADSNDKDTIIENFTKRLKDEYSVCDQFQNNQTDNTQQLNYKSLVKYHTGLIESKDIALRHFFNVFYKDDETKKLWKAFRCSDSTAHIGLLTFYQTLVHCHADLRLQSSKEYLADSNGRDVFVDKCDAQNHRERNNIFTKDERIVPGTQYLIDLPIVNNCRNNPIGEASLSNLYNFSEDYKTFAQYIDFEPEYIKLEPHLSSFLAKAQKYKITNPKDKFVIQLLWTKFWNNCFTSLNILDEENKVYVLRSNENINNYLSNVDNIEVFLKGMFGALSNDFKINKPIYFAITNLNSLFLDVLRSLSIALSNRHFPQGLQLYFIDSTYDKHAQFFGKSFCEVINNATHLAIEHGSTLFRYDDAMNAANIALRDSSSGDNTEAVAVMPFDTIITVNDDTKQTIFDAHMLTLIEERIDLENRQGYKLSNTHMRLNNKVHIQSFYEMSFLFYRTTIANRTAFKILRLYSKSLCEKIDKEKYNLSPILFYSYASYSKAILTSLVEMSREYVKLYISKLNTHMNEEALTDICDQAQAQIAFASYQHNLQSETDNDSVQLYFGVPEKFFGATVEKEEKNGSRILKLKSDINVILVVPISSTLTTFDKMFSKLKERVKPTSAGYKLNLSANYTSLWVCDAANFNLRRKDDLLFPTDIERKYWWKTNIKEQIIEVKAKNRTTALYSLKDCPQINFFLQVKAVWENPLFCSLCFPKENELIREIPLVETDLTSTVPSQQIRAEISRKAQKAFTASELAIENNNKRIKWLRDCVYYGHIKRGKNHYQYYINSQDYFYKNEVQTDVTAWLTKLKNDEAHEVGRPALKIIFSPEHNTNVGFAQYVNTYYFNGTAEIVSINEDKVFRSNFICEHKMLQQTIERLHIQQIANENWQPIEFYFVDDNINTGATIHKANNLLRSLIPEEYALKYPAFLFKKCFILIDRMSNNSKRSLVMSGKESDFHSYVHIDISNMRVHGDSCVGCKLKKETIQLFKRSASRITTNYWANKYIHLKPVDYDNLNDMEGLKNNTCAYERLVLSHIVQNYVFKDNIVTREKGEYYDSILFLFYAIFQYGEDKKYDQNLLNANFNYKDLLKNILNYSPKGTNIHKKSINDAKIHTAELLLKLLARPFFSFDYSFRIQIQSLLLIFSECYLDNYSNKENIDWETKTQELYEMIPQNDAHKGFLREDKRIDKTINLIRNFFMKYHADKPLSVSNFFMNILFEALADMRSTYLLRKNVIKRVDSFVNSYLSDPDLCGECNGEKGNCKKLLDDTQCKNKTAKKCFWVSYFSHIQRIVNCSSDEIKAIWFEYLVLSGNEFTEEFPNIKLDSYLGLEKHIKSNALQIVSELFLVTATTEYDVMQKLASTTNNARYFLNNYYETRKWKAQVTHKSNELNSLHEFLSKGYKDPNLNDTDQRYGYLLENLRDYISKLNKVNKGNLNIALLTMSRDASDASIDEIQLLKDSFGKCSTANQDLKQARYIIKDRVSEAFKCKIPSQNSVGVLTDNGYTIYFAENIDADMYQKQQKEISFSEHHISGNHRKPYIIFLFDNPNTDISHEELGRNLLPLNYVFLYISINEEDVNRRSNLPWLILRDILAYRNQLLKFFGEDFNGNLMEKHAVSRREEAILSHERSASHASTTDEKGVLRVFGLENVSKLKMLDYPINLNTNNIIDKTSEPVNYYYSADLWLLLQSYVNNQIARLFSRQFNEKDRYLIDNDGIPALYLSSRDEQAGNTFKKCLKRFGDLNITGEFKDQDNRFKLLKQATNIYCNINAKEKIYYRKDDEAKYYNSEYLFCVLMDIIFTALKYSTVNDSLLPRVDSLLYYNKNYDTEDYIKSWSCVKSYIFIIKDKNNLIILNNVKSSRINKNKIDSINEEIFRRTHDLLDYGDGHMSLFTIRKFILGIRNQDNKVDTSFKYIKNEKIKSQYRHLISNTEHINIIDSCNIWFETKLPIFEESTDDEHNNLD